MGKLSTIEKSITEQHGAAVSILHAHRDVLLKFARRHVADPIYVRNATGNLIDLFVVLGAVGYAREALALLETSPNADLLEPLLVGLRLFLGKRPDRVPVEVLEVGKDVRDRITDWQTWINGV